MGVREVHVLTEHRGLMLVRMDRRRLKGGFLFHVDENPKTFPDIPLKF